MITLEQLATLAARATRRAVSLHPSRQHSASATSPTDVIGRARAYLTTIPGAVSGQRGHDRTFYAANRLIRGFALTPDAALPLLLEWNQRCDPPWSENELRHKLGQADRQPGPRGFLLVADVHSPRHPKNVTSPATVLTNYTWDEIPDGDTQRRIRRGRPAAEILADIQAHTGGWPRRVGKLLFGIDSNGGLRWIESSQDLFAWLNQEFSSSGRSGIDWFGGGTDCITKNEFHAHCCGACESYESVELFPHYPLMEGVYYHHPEVPASDGSALNRLIKFFTPETTEDEDLIRSFFLSLFWGGPPGKRPLFVFEAAPDAKHQGRGTGKSTVVQIAGQLVGGLLALDPKEQIRDTQARLLSPSGRESRLACFDNIKTLRLSSAALEGLITARVISGKQMYLGEGRRLNSILWSITFNQPSLGKDLARRSLSIRLKTPNYRPTWETEVTEHITKNRWSIVGDCLTELGRPSEMPPGFSYSRWPVWEAEVLGKLPDPIKLQNLIEERRKELDDDDKIGEEIAAAIAKLIDTKAIRTGAAKDLCVLIPSQELFEGVAKKFNPDLRTAAHATMWLATIPIPGLSKHHAAEPYRGFIWRGDECESDQDMRLWKDI